MKINLKIASVALMILFFVTTNIFADTTIEGLPAQSPINYGLRIELFGNDTNRYLISIHPVNFLSVLYYSNYPAERPEEILKTKLTKEEYKQIYQKTYEVLKNFRILDKPHPIEDATNFTLSLNVNRREISVTYYSIPHIKEVSQDFYAILEIVNKYLPDNDKLKY